MGFTPSSQSGQSGKFLRCASDERNTEWVTVAGGSDAFPVGSVFIGVVATNPATLLGYGTWAAFGAGRVLVGLDALDTDFDTAEETGGAKTHTLTTAQMPAHTHTQRRNNVATGANTGWTTAFDASSSSPVADVNTGTGSTTATNQAATAVNQNAGGGGAHNNLQPYLVLKGMIIKTRVTPTR